MLKRTLLLASIINFSIFSDNTQQRVPQGDIGLKEQILFASAAGLSKGIGNAFAVPVRDVLEKIVAPFLRPVQSFESLQFNIFILSHSQALTFARLVYYQQLINNVINNCLINPAQESNKLLRRALVDQMSNVGEKVQDEYTFGVRVVLSHLNNLNEVLRDAVEIYKKERRNNTYSEVAALGGAAVTGVSTYIKTDDYKYAVSGVVLGATAGYLLSKLKKSPYSRDDLNQIIFCIEQLQEHIEFMISVIGNLKDLTQITDKKDTIVMLLKSFTAEVAHLCFIIEPSKAFDPKYKGLKLIYDDAKLLLDRAAVKQAA